MGWQNNLFSNLLVVFILSTLAAIIYCRMKNTTLPELFKEIKEIISPSEVIE